eukprot:scaffold122937_cov30-Tisochrysis_lutea.AAC.3
MARTLPEAPSSNAAGSTMCDNEGPTMSMRRGVGVPTARWRRRVRLDVGTLRYATANNAR